MNRISSGFTGAIASAVAGEVNRLAAHPEFFRSEGVAYKAAFDRMGGDANALRYCADHEADRAVMACGVRYGRKVCLSLAGVMKRPGPQGAT